MAGRRLRRVVRSSEHLRVPTDSNSKVGNQPSVDGQPIANDPDFSHVAAARVVSGSAVPSGRGTERTAPLAKPPASAPYAGSSRSPGTTEASRVESIQHILRERGFSLSIAREMSGSFRTSSADVYQGMLAIFCGWCRQRGMSPVSTTIQQIADFLV